MCSGLCVVRVVLEVVLELWRVVLDVVLELWRVVLDVILEFWRVVLVFWRVDFASEPVGGWTSLWWVVGYPCGWVGGSSTARARVAACTPSLGV